MNQSQGILTLTSSSPSVQLNTELNIPIQTIRLTGYRVEYNLASNALADQILYIELPFLSRNQIIDNNIGYVYLPIQLDNAIVTIQSGMSRPILLTSAIPERFTMNVRKGPGSNFALVGAQMVHICLTFQLEYGHLL